MLEILSNAPNTVIGWVAFVTLGVLGAFALFDRVMQSRQKRANQLDTDLIARYERNMEDLQKELTHVHNNQLQREKTELELDKAREIEYAKMKGQHDTVVAILQGRNTEMDEVVKAAPAVFALSRETHEIVRSMAAGMNDLTAQVSKLTSTLEAHLSTNE